MLADGSALLKAHGCVADSRLTSLKQVVQELSRMAEAQACGLTNGAKLTVLSLGALTKAESELAKALELRASGEMRNEALRDELRRRKDFRSKRLKAQQQLRTAHESGKKVRLSTAYPTATLCKPASDVVFNCAG